MDIDSINFDLSGLTAPIIVIIGPPGAGKTEVGCALAQNLDWLFLDTDVIIERACNTKVTDIFSRHGEKVFRLLEKKLVAEINKLYKNIKKEYPKTQSGTVISTGGGLPVTRDNFANLAQIGTLISLDASIDVLNERAGRKGNRPLLNLPVANDNNLPVPDGEGQKSRLKMLVEQRKEIYAQANFSVDTSNLSIEAVVACIKAELGL